MCANCNEIDSTTEMAMPRKEVSKAISSQCDVGGKITVKYIYMFLFLIFFSINIFLNLKLFRFMYF